MRRPGPGRAAATLLSALLLAGCGDGSGAPAVSGSTEEATVKGTVKIHGKPVNNGSVLFNPANVRRPDAQARQAPINKDGTYTLTTLVGTNYVEVACKELRTPANRMLAETQLTVEVTSGENAVDLAIP